MNHPTSETSFDEVLLRYLAAPELALDPASGLLEELIAAWGNPWSGQSAFLRACLHEVLVAQGPMLECGSGLSTILAGVLAQQRQLPLWALEHQPDWAQRTIAPIRRHRIKGTTLLLVQLQSFGSFDWYAVPPQALPERVSLVICDGPPGTTRGGRYGLLPCLRDRLAPGCVILLDDADRPQEQAIASRWQQELGAECRAYGRSKPFYRLRLRS